MCLFTWFWVFNEFNENMLHVGGYYWVFFSLKCTRIENFVGSFSRQIIFSQWKKKAIVLHTLVTIRFLLKLLIFKSCIILLGHVYFWPLVNGSDYSKVYSFFCVLFFVKFYTKIQKSLKTIYLYGWIKFLSANRLNKRQNHLIVYGSDYISCMKSTIFIYLVISLKITYMIDDLKVSRYFICFFMYV